MKRLVILGSVGVFAVPMAVAFGASVIAVPDAPAATSAPFVVPPGIGHVTYASGPLNDLPRVDPRITALLAASPWDLHVGVLITGHKFFVHGTDRMSNHIPGRAVDITKVGGQPVSASNEAARQFVQWLTTYTPRPDEVGSPFTEFAPLPGFFTDADHQNHIHAGYDG
jgi:hypothetical protein